MLKHLSTLNIYQRWQKTGTSLESNEQQVTLVMSCE